MSIHSGWGPALTIFELDSVRSSVPLRTFPARCVPHPTDWEEGITLDPRFGYFVNQDLAEYLVPVHADVSDVDAIFLPELDNKSNPLKSKGVGELGICGAGASLANAIYNACGARIRDYPITLDKVLAALPMQT